MVIVDLTSVSNPTCDLTYPIGRNALLQKEFREKLLEMTQKKHYSTNVYRETLKYLLAYFGKFSFLDGENKLREVPVIHGNQERAVGKILEQKTLVLPLISVSQETTSNDDGRNRYSPVLIHDKYWDAKAQRAVRILSFSSRAINIYYSIGIWTAYRSDMDQLLEQIRLAFNPSIEIATPQSTLAKAFIIDEVDSSDIDLIDGVDRLIQKTLNIEVNAYIQSPRFIVTSTGKIEELNAEIEIC